VITEVWIENLRAFPNDLVFRGKVVDRAATIEALTALFGPCKPADDAFGGTLLSCDFGVTLGLDAQGSEDAVQIRLAPV
jgi:hypothetical protein